VSPFASLARASGLIFWGVFLCVAPVACTESSDAGGPTELVRHVPPSNSNLALSFDGVGDYATTGTAEFPIGRGTQTLSVWFEASDVSGKHALLTLRKDEDSGVEFGLEDGLVSAWRVFGNRLLVAAPTAIAAGGWHHAAYSFDTTTNQIYVDGALVASSTTVPDDRTPTTSWLGTLDGTSDLFKGAIDDFRVFNVARSSEQIAAEAAGNFSSDDPGLVLDLPCDESAGNVVYDHSDLGNDGELGDGIAERAPARVDSGAPSDTN
jgi:hypothetical protein